MLLYISEDTFTGPATADTATAIRYALTSREWGYSSLLVTPGAPQAARLQGLDEQLAAGLDIAQRGWLEGQTLLETLSRVVALVDDVDRHGSQRGNMFEVATSFAVASGVFREPVLVTENMATDGAFLSMIFSLWNQRDEADLERFWNVRLEQGGGDTIRNYVGRYAGQPEPMAIVCDRDSVALPQCGNTVKNCVSDILAHGLFACRDTAKAGGFTPLRSNFAFEITDAWSVESLIFPNISQLLLRETMNVAEVRDRMDSLAGTFPTFPRLDDASAESWLSTNFRTFHNGSSAWNSNSVQRFTAWVRAGTVSRAEAQSAFDQDYRIAPFRRAMDKVCNTLVALGVRDHRLL